MTRKVTVLVEGREYVVEVGDLNETPIRARVNQRDYNVQVPASPTEKPAPTAPSASPSPRVSAPSAPKPAALPVGVNTITAPMPGDIIAVEVRPGESVSAGDVVCVLEAMKMKNMIRTAQAGVIASVEVSPGQAVDYGAVLVILE